MFRKRRNVDTTEKRDIFLSHRHLDGKPYAKLLEAELRNRGFTVWLDDITLRTGSRLDSHISDAIKQVGLYVAIVTPAFCKRSSWAYKEFLLAQQVQTSRFFEAQRKKTSQRPTEFIFPVLHNLAGPEAVQNNRPLRNYLAGHSYYLSAGETIEAKLIDRIVDAFGVVEDVTKGVPDTQVEIGRFPVTNLEYARFINAGGYSNEGLERWWSSEGVDFWLHYAARRHHVFFGRREDATVKRTEDASIEVNFSASNLLFNQFGQPVTGVCYFEAQAYCNWLSEKLGRTVRLPSEREWLLAALRAEEKYPWGNDRPVSREVANIVTKPPSDVGALSLDTVDLAAIGKVSTPTVFGKFEHGVSHVGCHDMFGNVWEWLNDLLDSDIAKTETDDPYNIAKIAGHCCFDSASTIENRPSPIALRRPGYRHHVIGFRIAIETL